MYGAKSENLARDIFDHSRTPLVEVELGTAQSHASAFTTCEFVNA